jgi:hypothetical protein
MDIPIAPFSPWFHEGTLYYVKTPWGASGHRLEDRPGQYADVVELGVFPDGEVRAIQLDGAIRLKQDGLRWWSDGDIIRIPGYFTRDIPDPGFEGHDFCPWCGTNNGLNGCLREGWDCYGCGGS